MNRFLNVAMLLTTVQLYSFFPSMPHTHTLDPETIKSMEDATHVFKATVDRARESLEKATDKFDKSIDKLVAEMHHDKFSHIMTQGGIVLTAAATAILAAYAVFLIVKYELSRQPDDHAGRKGLSWKTILAGALGASIFSASVGALITSGSITHYVLHQF